MITEPKSGAVHGGSLARCVIVCPVYSRRQALPHLAASVAEWARLLRQRGAVVEELAAERPFDVLDGLDRLDGEGPLLVYVGGHGLVTGREHYTLFDTTPLPPKSTTALWTRQLAQHLAQGGRDVVLLLDTCFSGEALAALPEAMRVLAESPTSRSFGILASCRAYETISDGVFVEALLRVSHQGATDATAWGPSDEYVPLGALGTALRVAGVEARSFLVDDAYQLRVVPNLGWDPAESEGRVSAKISARLRRLGQSTEAHLLDMPQDFVGRRQLRARIIAWLESADNGMFVVTGGPGTGKSALMGLLARQSLGDVSAMAVHGPCLSPGAFDLVLHVRQKTTDQIRDQLVAIEEGHPATVLVDALDEAVAGESMAIAAYLRKLCHHQGTRMVVGTRPSPVVAAPLSGQDPLLDELDADVMEDLGHLESAAADIAELVAELLEKTSGAHYAGRDNTELTQEVATRTAPSFLFAHAAARLLTGRGVPITEEPGWRSQLDAVTMSRDIGQLVADDLATRFDGPDLVRAHDLLRALAWSEGLGLPRYGIWPRFAEALSGPETRYGDSDVTWIVNEAGWYITESHEDGQTVYRLFHQSVIEYFRAETRIEQPQVVLTRTLQSVAEDAGGWDRADPYILHYLVAHAGEAAAPFRGPAPELAALVGDASFVVRAEPRQLSRTVVQFRNRIDGSLFALLRLGVHEMGRLRPPDRLALLTLTALQEGEVPPAARAAPRSSWVPEWAAWARSSPHIVLTSDDGPVHAVAFSPDGTSLASGGTDGSLRLWDPDSGQTLRTFRGHAGRVNAVAFAPDGTLIASAGTDSTVRIWDAATGHHLRTWRGHDGPVNDVAFAPDATLMASAGTDSTVRFWDPAAGRLVSTRHGHTSRVNAVTFSPDGSLVASGGTDRRVRIWQPANPYPLRSLRGHKRPVHALAFAPDGKNVASASTDGTIRVWDSETSHLRHTLHGHDGRVLTLAFAPDGSKVASAGTDRTVCVWDLATCSPLLHLPGHHSWINAVAYSPDGATIASASSDGTIRLWSPPAGAGTVPFHHHWVHAVALAPDGSLVASGGTDGTIRLSDPATGHPVRVLPGHDDWVHGLAFAPTGATLASAGADGAIRLWDLVTGRQLRTLNGHTGSVYSVAFAPGGSMLASGGTDGAVRLWRPATGEALGILAGHTDRVNAVTFAPDGNSLASASTDRTIRVRDLLTGRHLHTLKGHSGPVHTVAFSPDGSMLASGGTDGTIRLWRPASEQTLRTLTGHTQAVNAVAFAAGGALLASGSGDGTIRVWRPTTGDVLLDIPVRGACRDLGWHESRIVVGSSAGLAAVRILL